MIYEFNAAEVFQLAIEIEENGRIFYEKARERIGDPAVEKEFADLARQEMNHRQRFMELKAQLPDKAGEGKVWDPENETDQYLKMMAGMNVFRTGESLEGLLAGVNTTADALKLGIQFEKDSIIFFLTMQKETAEGSGRDQISLLVQEEQEHLKRLLSLLRQAVK